MEDSNYWTRLRNRRVSRRSLLGAGGTLALGAGAAAIVGCGGGDDGDDGPKITPTPRPVPSLTPGGSVTQGRPLTVLGIDPHIDLTGLDIDTYIYPYLYGWIPGKEEIIFNNLAEDVEIIDDVEFTFTLKPGFKNAPFTDVPGGGEELTSEDCKQSFFRRGTSISAPDKRFPRKIAGSVDPAALESALFTPDKYTFKFKMSEPFVPSLREMANPTWAIVSAKVLEAREGRGLSQVGYGAGPFMVEEFRGDERVVLRKNPNYYHQGRPYLDGLTIVVITDNSSLLSAFEQGQHDISGAILTKSDYEDFSENSDFVVGTAPSLFYPVVHMKVQRAPFDNIKVREALDISINRDEIIAVIQSGEGNYSGPIQWAQFKWALPQEELREFYKYNPEKARTLLEEAGYPNGFSTKMKLPKITGVSFIADLAVLLKDQWSRVGIDVELDEVELGAFIGSTLLPGNFDMAFFPNLPYDEPDRPLAFYSSLGVTGAGNWTNYTNPELDALIDAQAKEYDPVLRKNIIDEAQRMILQEHGPQLTTTSGYAYSAHWYYVHLPFELGQDPSQTTLPNGVDIWTEKV